MPLLLGYGARPLPLDPPTWAKVRALAPPAPPEDQGLDAALDRALAHPAGARPLREVATARTRVVLAVPGEATPAPRAALVAAVRRALAALPDDHLTLAVANGPGGPSALDRLGLPAELLGRLRVVNHDAADARSLVEMGTTSRGTKIRVNRCVAEADLVVAAGRVGPHPLAGWSGGALTLFPGLGGAAEARHLDALAQDPGTALGCADANPWREDAEEAVRRLGRDTWLLDAVVVGGRAAGAAAGDLVLAHREAVRLARPWCEVEARPAACVVASAPFPAPATLRHAAALLPAAGRVVAPGGTVILAAECAGGAGPASEGDPLGPEARRPLPAGCEVVLVSALPADTARSAGLVPTPSLAAALDLARRRAGGGDLDLLVLPDASDLVPVAAGR